MQKVGRYKEAGRPEPRESGRDQIMKEHECHVEELGHYPEGSWEPWNGLPFD